MSNQDQALEKRPKNEVLAALAHDDKFKKQVALALPNLGITAERLLRVVLTSCQRNPKLFRCTKDSMMESVMMCAETGLLPGPMGLCHIIPYANKATFQLGYKGLVQLLWRSEQISTIRSEVVREKDTFRDRIGQPPLWKPHEGDGDAGERRGCFATIGTTTGGWITSYWPWNRIEEHRDQFSKAYRRDPDGSAWATNPDPMACKTMVIQVSKLAPISTEAQTAIAAHERQFAGVDLSDMDMQDLAAGPMSAENVLPAEGEDEDQGQQEQEQAPSPRSQGSGDDGTQEPDRPSQGESRPPSEMSYEEARDAVLSKELEANLDPDAAKEIRKALFRIKDDRGMSAERWQNILNDWNTYCATVLDQMKADGGEGEGPPVSADEIPFE